MGALSHYCFTFVCLCGLYGSVTTGIWDAATGILRIFNGVHTQVEPAVYMNVVRSLFFQYCF